MVGFSFDMLAYFLLSYVTYLIYNVAVYCDSKLIMGDLNEDNPVKLTDVVFSIVAFLCTCFQTLQCLIYDRGSQEIHRSTVVLCILCLLVLGVLTALSSFGIGSWFLVLQYCGYVKLVVSFGTVSFYILEYSTVRQIPAHNISPPTLIILLQLIVYNISLINALFQFSQYLHIKNICDGHIKSIIKRFNFELFA